jgi:hypothetical protein
MAAVAAVLNGVDPDGYNPFSVLVASRQGAFVASGLEGRVAITSLPHGVHLLTNLAVNDPTCPRIAASAARFQRVQVEVADPETLVAALRLVLSDHTTALDPRATDIGTLCVHRPGYGTRSSAIVTLPWRGPAKYWFADGPPCRTPFTGVALPAV